MNILQMLGFIPAFASNIFYIFVAIFVLLLMITIHEFGHYLAGKKLGFKINEFAIGFGKKLYSRKLENGEEFSLRAIPLGGYCAFEGEDDDSNNPNAFNNQKPWKRLIVLVSGALFNFLSAIIFAVILLTAYGYDVPEIVNVYDDSPNYTVTQEQDGTWYGVQEDDIIWGVDGQDITVFNGNLLNNLLAEYEVGQDIVLNIERNDEKLDTIIQLYEVPAEDAEGQPILDEDDNQVYKKVMGVNVKPYAFPFFKAVARSIPFALGLAWEILSFLFLLITGQVGFSGVGGPITTISIIAGFAQSSLAGFLVLLPLIAINLAVFNLLPFPALDGARMTFVGIEWIRGKPVDPKIEGYIHFVGLMLLFILVFTADFYQLLT